MLPPAKEPATHQHSVTGPQFWVGMGESYAELCTLHPVWMSNGMCGCGKEELKGKIAYFPDRLDALNYARDRQRQADSQLENAGGKG